MGVEELKEITKDWSCSKIMTVINKELYNTDSLGKKVELLIFKCEILENSTYGKTHKPPTV